MTPALECKLKGMGLTDAGLTETQIGWFHPNVDAATLYVPQQALECILKLAREVVRLNKHDGEAWDRHIKERSLAEQNLAEKQGRIRELEVELNEHERLFNVRWQADQRAIGMWHASGGDTLTWPNHADLVVWLLEQNDLLRKKLAENVDAELIDQQTAMQEMIEERDREIAALKAELANMTAQRDELQTALSKWMDEAEAEKEAREKERVIFVQENSEGQPCIGNPLVWENELWMIDELEKGYIEQYGKYCRIPKGGEGEN